MSVFLLLLAAGSTDRAITVVTTFTRVIASQEKQLLDQPLHAFDIPQNLFIRSPGQSGPPHP